MVVKLKLPVSTTWNEIMSGEFVEAKCQRGYSGTIVRLCGNHTTDTA